MDALLIPVGSKMPIPALMKLSADYKSKGYRVFLNQPCNPEKVEISVIFDWDKAKALGMAKIYSCPVRFGGPAFGVALPNEIEHLMPDYSLYGIDYFMGATSRGCSRACKFCKVFSLEGPIREHSWFDEFVLPKHKKGILLDDNFLMSSKREEKLDIMIEKKWVLSLCQGWDARLIDSLNLAQKIAKVRSYDWRFKNQAWYTAWDRIEDESEVLQGIDYLVQVGIKPRNIRPYVLVAYDSTIEEDVYRFEKLRERGTCPFVMPYNRKKHPLKRYGQRPAFYKTTPIREYLKQIQVAVIPQ